MFFKRLSNWVFILIALILVRFALLHNNPLVTSWDNFGYYLILPQTFIYGDPGNKNIEQIDSLSKKYNLTPYLYQVHKHQNGNHITQYSLGLAVIYSPGFFLGHAIAKLFGYNADGYSPPYQWSLLVVNLLFIFVGLVWLFRILQKFYSERLSLFLIIIVFFGTNLFMYSTGGYGTSHTYLFLFFVALIDWSIKWNETYQRKYAVYIGLIMGLMVITRPTEILAFLIPVFWGVSTFKSSLHRVRLLLTSHFWSLFWCGIAFLAVFMLQLSYWKIYTGQWLYYSYRNPGEGFEFLHPHTWEFLFSFRKGWFIYTPVMFIAIIGLFYAVYRKTPFGFATLIFVIITVFVLSSWSSWWYAASFSQRPMIESYPLYIIALGFFFQHLLLQYRKAAKVLAGFIGFLIFFNLFQTYQYYYCVLSWDRMTFDYYVTILGKTEMPPKADTLLLVDRIHDFKMDFPEASRYKKVHEAVFPVKPDSSNIFILTQSNSRKAVVDRKFSNYTNSDHLWVHASFLYYYKKGLKPNDAWLVGTVVNKKKLGYGWQNMFFIDTLERSEGWKTTDFYYLTPPMRLPTDDLSFFFEAASNDKKVLVKNVKFEFLERKY